MRAIQALVGILMIIGLSLGIGFGVYQEYDGKNLRELARVHAELRARAVSAEDAAAAALQQVREERKRLALYIDYIVGQVEAP